MWTRTHTESDVVLFDVLASGIEDFFVKNKRPPFALTPYRASMRRLLVNRFRQSVFYPFDRAVDRPLCICQQQMAMGWHDAGGND